GPELLAVAGGSATARTISVCAPRVVSRAMAVPPADWEPDAALLCESNVARFMAAEHVRDFSELVARSIDDPEWFWDAVVRFLGKGDAVGLLLPMVPETVASLFAVAKLGAVFLPIFSGYGAEAVAVRLADADAVALITADGFTRRGKQIAMKEIGDGAVAG